MPRKKVECYPDFTAELDAIRDGGITPQILSRIIRKHRGNARWNQKLFDRYAVLEDGVPIFRRHPRFEKGSQLNNRLNNDFFSEIVDFKTGYFAGSPISYSYSSTAESKAETGSEAAADDVSKELTDFVMRSNMYDVDMQCVKYAAICGYCARLFYIDRSEKENVMPVFPYQAALLSENGDISQPDCGVRYYRTRDINDSVICKAEFYDDTNRYRFSGASFDALKPVDEAPHTFSFCPLQGLQNNEEMTGDAEKVIALIDEYDKCLSDSANELENHAQAYMIFENVQMSPEALAQSQQSGSIQLWNGNGGSKVYYLTKDINDTFLQNHCNRLEKNIYHCSKTPNIADEAFGTASGISLKFKLTELETKCGMLQAKMQSAGMYMFHLLSDSWRTRLRLNAVPSQFIMDFSRNFPLDALSEAQAAQAMISSGLPKRLAFANAYSFVDDVDYVMDLVAEEEGDTASLYVPEEPNASEGA